MTERTKTGINYIPTPKLRKPLEYRSVPNKKPNPKGLDEGKRLEGGVEVPKTKKVCPVCKKTRISLDSKKCDSCSKK
jgi:hypothetical protein